MDVALFDSALSTLTFQASSALAGTGAPSRMGNLHPSLAPYEVFEASDRSFALGIGTDALWKRLCEVLKSHGFSPDAGLGTNAGRIGQRDMLHVRLQEVFAIHSVEHWLRVLKQADIPCGAINPVPVALCGEQVSAREMVREIPHPELGPVKHVGIPVKLSATPGSLRRSPPRLGEHNEEIYSGWLGLSATEQQDLRNRGVI